MEPETVPRRGPEPKSGGKMVRPRRHAVGPRTPYDRPRITEDSPLPNQPNPNWISRLILSPTRFVVSGTGKLLSSVFSGDTCSSDGSCSDDESDDDTDVDVDVDVGDEHDVYNSLEPTKDGKNNETPMEWGSETKRKIEQLIMQESFSREECGRLILTIKSRVIDGGTENQGVIETPNKIFDGSTEDLWSTAIMEARKWLEEKKSGSNSKSQLDLGTSMLNNTILPDVAETDMGSPVDVARSYMQTRPPWASPTSHHMELKSPLLTGIQLFKEGTPYSMGRNAISSSKLKQDFSGTGSWNIMEEIRKVRSKATEEMLKSSPSSKIDWSRFVSEHKSSRSHFAGDRSELATGNNTKDTEKPVETSWNLTTTVTDPSSLPEFTPSVLKATQDGLQDEPSTNPASFALGQNKDLEANRIMKETEAVDVDGHNDTNGDAHHDIEQVHKHIGETLQFDLSQVHMDVNGSAQHDPEQFHDSRLPDENHLATEVPETHETVVTNGLPSSGSSPVRLDGEHNTTCPHDEEHSPIVTGHEMINAVPEASIEEPIIRENDTVPSASQNSSSMHQGSSSMHQEWVAETPTRPKSKRRAANKDDNVVEQQPARRGGRTGRRGRGRGRY